MHRHSSLANIHSATATTARRWAVLLCLAGAALICAAPAAEADILVTRDGDVHPKMDEITAELQADIASGKTIPGGNLLSFTHKHVVKLSYDKVSIGRFSTSAAQVDMNKWWSSLADQNEAYGQGQTAGNAGSFAEAAAYFLRAADDLKGSAKELALWNSVQAHWANQDAPNIIASADALLAEFPKSFYFAKATTYKAIVYLTQGKSSAARAAFDAIINAPNMNAADMFRAELDKIEYFQFKTAGNDPAKYGKAEQAYESIRRQIQGHPKREDASVELKLAQVGIGKCQVFQEKLDDAVRSLSEVVADNTITDKALLSSAYEALGNALYASAKKAESTAETEADKAKALEMFRAAEDPYLRVCLIYGSEYPQAASECTMNLARVYANQFVLTGETDEPLGQRALQYYIKAYHGLDRSDRRRRPFGNEAKGFQDQLAAAFPSEEGEKDGN